MFLFFNEEEIEGKKRNKQSLAIAFKLIFKMTSKEDILRKRVYQFFEKHSDKPKSFTVNHFKDEGEARSTIYRIIKRA